MANLKGITTSVFEMFKVGIGPSSSHTVGPMMACVSFINVLNKKEAIHKVERVQVELYGSLCLTGKGHSTDVACCYGLLGFKPDTIDLEVAKGLLDQTRKDNKLLLGGFSPVSFSLEEDIIWKPHAKEYHPNALVLRALAKDGNKVEEETYYSIGGGFIQSQTDIENGNMNASKMRLDQEYLKFTCAADMLEICRENECNFSDIILYNEQAIYGKTREQIFSELDKIWDVMSSCIHNGLNSTHETLPGKLQVQRRAPRLKKQV